MSPAPYSPSFLERHLHELKELAIVLFMAAFLAAYVKVPFVQSIVDKAVDPAVEGLALVFGELATELYRTTGVDVGFTPPPPDPDFVFRVELATYVNERRAQPLLDMADDLRLPAAQREQALLALLKFDSVSEWIQPFLNELSKGGMPGLYDDSPALNEVMQRIRSEGGIRSGLVRAYGEVVFSFLLHHPDAVLRKKAAHWLSDVLAEDALALIIPRLEREEDPAVRAALEDALWDIRAVSDKKDALTGLLPYYKKPSWPSLRLPLSAVMSRLGFHGAQDVARSAGQAGALTTAQRVALNLALTGTPFPSALIVTQPQRTAAQERERARQRQYAAAVEKRRLLRQQERLKQQLLVRADLDERRQAPERKNREPSEAEPPEPGNESHPRAVAPPVEPSAEEPVAPSGHEPEERAPSSTLVEKGRALPHHFRAPGESAEPEEPSHSTKIASLPPEETLPPDEPLVEKKPKSLMNYVDLVFEVKKQDVQLYQNAGGGQIAGTLPVGTKGRADFEVLIGEDHWYQVKSKKGSGWANGELLSVFDLSGGASIPAVAAKKSEGGGDEGDVEGAARKESTYFETTSDGVPFYEKPSEWAKKAGKLTEGIAYLAMKSEKVGEDRWFLLQVKSRVAGWANGLNLQLANVQQPAQLSLARHPLSQRDKKSAFQAEWVVPGVKGVGVYSRPSIAGKMIQQISPPKVFKVQELLTGGGQEWYRITLANKKEGWVQALDVNLTKAPE